MVLGSGPIWSALWTELTTASQPRRVVSLGNSCYSTNLFTDIIFICIFHPDPYPGVTRNIWHWKKGQHFSSYKIGKVKGYPLPKIKVWLICFHHILAIYTIHPLLDALLFFLLCTMKSWIFAIFFCQLPFNKQNSRFYPLNERNCFSPILYFVHTTDLPQKFIWCDKFAC